ncbi:hypothetical protein [Bacillus cereus]
MKVIEANPMWNNDRLEIYAGEGEVTLTLIGEDGVSVEFSVDQAKEIVKQLSEAIEEATIS